jgi:hypothetical protein
MVRRVVLIAFASGCLFPALDDLAGGGDASGVDAVSEQTITPDASDVQQPPADAGIDADAEEAGPFCAQHPTATFCADFDESADAGAGFTNTYLTSGGVVARDTAIYATSPASLLAGNSALDASSTSHGAEVRNTGVTPTTGITLDFDLRIDKLASQGTYIEALAIVINAPTKSSIQLNLKSASSAAGEEIVGLDGGQTYVGHGFAALATNQWMHVTIAVAFVPSRTLTVTIDKNAVVDHVTLDATFSSLGPVDLFLGNAYAPGPSDGATIHYDNAVLVVN